MGCARLLFAHFTESTGPNLVLGAVGVCETPRPSGVGEGWWWVVGRLREEPMFISRAFQEFTKRVRRRRGIK